MISVRLSEDEYAALRRLCQATGARSVSDLTRDAMRGLIENGTREDALGTRMEEFRAQMKSHSPPRSPRSRQTAFVKEPTAMAAGGFSRVFGPSN
jgi:Arc/MetJ-type ribon-helix-helix transcriptional regulator